MKHFSNYWLSIIIITTTCLCTQKAYASVTNNDYFKTIVDGSCNAGVSPGEVNICGDPICLIDLLEGSPDPGGVWTGPDDWVSSDDCGNFDPSIALPGDYTYTVEGLDDAVCTATISMIYHDIGNVENVYWCQPSPLNLFTEVTLIEELPTDGDWYFPDTYPDPSGIVPDGIVDPNIDGEGYYEYIFYNAENCLTRASTYVIFSTGGAGGMETWVDVCPSTGLFCPYDVLDANPAPGGQWIRYNADGNFTGFYPDYDVCLISPNFENGEYFTYALFVPPCAPSFVDLHINIVSEIVLANDTSHLVCIAEGDIILNTLISDAIEPGGEWTNPDGEMVSNLVNTMSAVEGIYTYTLIEDEEAPCPAVAHVNLTFEQLPYSGTDTILDFCADGSEIFLADYLVSDAPVEGLFDIPSILASEDNAGIVTYTVESEVCGFDQAAYQIDINALPVVSDLSIDCNLDDPTLYNVSFEATEGLLPYTAANGIFDSALFTSEMFSVADEPEFVILFQDQNGCVGEISGAILDANDNGICDDGETNGVGEGLNQVEFSVYPNPLKLGLNLQIELSELMHVEDVLFELHDLTGRLVWQQMILVQNETYTVAMTQKVDAGTYLFSVVTKTGERLSSVLFISD